ncbi:hypothetical protein [Streptomyces djakartensis]|uniref:hypothetical protein n=1 Tax=Streptomyces djakartensis TaxID=68193 RepID=UPI00167E5F42|nr:hypothetical protein [Streptomyces djakartensis]
MLLLGVEGFGMPLLGVDARSGPLPVDVEGDAVGVLEVGGVVLEGADWVGLWFEGVVFGLALGVWLRLPLVLPLVESVAGRGVVPPPGVAVPGLLRGVVASPGGMAEPGLLRGGMRSPGVVPGVFRGESAWPGSALPGRWDGIRTSGVLGARPSPAPGVRPSGVGAGVLRGAVGDVGLGVEAGPVPVAEGVPGTAAEGFLAGAGVGLGLVADEALPELPEPPEPWCVPPGTVPPLEGAAGDVGMAEPPSERLPAGEGSAVVGVGAALDCVGAPAARLSIWVPIDPPPGEEDVPPDAVGEGADCGEGEERPETEVPLPVWEGPEALGVTVEPFESEPLDEGPPGEGSSKSDSDGPEVGVGLEYGESEEDESRPESGPGPES